ncbi:SDR family NAD(P)-dependent oxidoreductase [bacterium]|nr:SDR family NAD(P)-dependent oxidoreductase [bacterium]MDC0305368.1 SDR family NAD(P)-dependent oxidoreductase [bacterium]
MTGASSGIGRALVITLAEPGKHLYLPARREVNLHELATTIKSLGSKSLSLKILQLLNAQIFQTDDRSVATEAQVPLPAFCSVVLWF